MKPFHIAQAIAQAIALGVLVNRLRHGAHMSPAKPVPVKPVPAKGDRVSVLIPARNEAGRIAKCLEGLEDVHEVIVVDDCSTDETAAVADKLGARVIAGHELPAGWIGKSWALQQGLDQATGDVVVCLDADTIPRPGLIGALVEQLGTADFVSFACRFRCDTIAEVALNTSMLTTLVYRFGPPGAPLRSHRAIANGQCMAFRRDWFVSQGGFHGIRGHMTDDIALARMLSKFDARVKFLDGSALIEVDMHDGVRNLWNEWGRSLPMPDASSRAQQWSDLALLWLTLVVPIPRLLTRRGNVFDALFVLIRASLGFGLRRAYVSRTAGVYLSPVSDIPAILRLTQATLWSVRTWRGREYGPQNRSRNAGL